MKTITIHFSKLRSMTTLMIGVLYVALGIGLTIQAPFMFIVGLPVVLFFGRRVWVGWQQLTGKMPALIIDKDGIVDNIYWHSVGRISWSDISKIKTKQAIPFVKNIRIILEEPFSVIGREKYILKRFFQAWYTLFQKTPIQINSWFLAISYNELANIFMNIDLDDPNFTDFSEHLIS